MKSTINPGATFSCQLASTVINRFRLALENASRNVTAIPDDRIDLDSIETTVYFDPAWNGFRDRTTGALRNQKLHSVESVKAMFMARAIAAAQIEIQNQKPEEKTNG